MGGREGGSLSQPKLIFYTNLIKTDVIIGVGSLPLPCQSQSNGQEAVIILRSSDSLPQWKVFLFIFRVAVKGISLVEKND